MIKLSWMARANTNEVFQEQVNFARELNLDAIDFHVGGMPRDPLFVRRIKRQCLQLGLPIGYLGSGSMTGPLEEREARIKEMKEDIDLAEFMGAQMIRAFARHKWPETKEEQEKFWKPMIEDFQKVCDYAAEKGVFISLQNHDNSSFCMTADQVLRIYKDVARDNFSFILDTGQWYKSIGADPRGVIKDPNLDIYETYIKATAPIATCVRAKIYRIHTGKEEYLDYPRIMKILKDVNFNGTMSIVMEHVDKSYEYNHVMRLAATYLRTLLADYNKK
ncbi:MAG: sugar phosphate isomerase/epimerase [SAR202 cluster bacterium]|nr:sugar phosphate isomerase/epimerase [SAR202 cluster bacterium]